MSRHSKKAVVFVSEECVRLVDKFVLMNMVKAFRKYSET